VSWPECEPGTYRIQLRVLGTEVDVITDLHSRVNRFKSRPNVILPSLGLVIVFAFLVRPGAYPDSLYQGLTNPGCLLTLVFRLCMVASNSYSIIMAVLHVSPCMFKLGTIRTRQTENGQVTCSQFSLEFGDFV